MSPDPEQYVALQAKVADLERQLQQCQVELQQAKALQADLQPIQPETLAFQASLLDQIHHAVICTDSEGKITYWNQSAEVLYQWKAEEVLGCSLEDKIAPPGRESVIAAGFAKLRRIHQPSEGEYLLQRKNGSLLTVRLITTALRNQQGEVTGLASISRDISDRQATEKALTQSEQKAVNILASITDAFLSLDEQWRFTYLNPQAEVLLNRSAQELLGQNIWREFPHLIHSKIYYDYHYALIYKQSTAFETYSPICQTWYEIRIHPFEKGIFVYFQDISDRKRIENEYKQTAAALQQLNQELEQRVQERTQALRQSETLLRETQHVARLGSWEFDVAAQKVTWSIEKFRIFGLDPSQGEPTYERLLQQYIHPDDQKSLASAVTRALEQAEPYTLDLRIIQPDGTPRYVLEKGQPILNSQGQVIKLIGIAMDISDRKQAEEAVRQQAQREQLLRVITHRVRQSLDLDEILATAVAEVRRIFQADRALIFRLLPGDKGQIIKEAVLPDYPILGEGQWVDACLDPNSLMHYRVGQPRIVADVALDEWGECLGQLLRRIGIRSKISAPIIKHLEDGSSQIWGLLIIHACGAYRQWLPEEAGFLQQISNQLAIAIQQADLYHRVQIELAERKQVEEQLRASLQEKEVLLKEVHHRVKNNMQMISSLLNLQADSIQDPEILKPFIESQRRLKTMALIHEKLYQSNNLAKINFANYVKQLGDELLRSFREARPQIQLRVEVVNIDLTVDTAIPCGLIINELVSNALKYAFPERRSGTIWICFYPEPDNLGQHSRRYILVVRDNGVGISPEVDLSTTESLGLQIVHTLAQKLNGSIMLKRTDGTEFSITLPLPEQLTDID